MGTARCQVHGGGRGRSREGLHLQHHTHTNRRPFVLSHSKADLVPKIYILVTHVGNVLPSLKATGGRL